jgi:hypothetical protein
MGDVTSIDQAKPGKRKRTGHLPARKSQATAHLPEGATRAEARRAGRLTKAKRRSDVLTLATAGHTADRIAELLTVKYEGEGLGGITARSVEGTIHKALEDWKETDSANVESVRAMQLHRLDTLLTAISAKAMEGNLKAVDRVLRLEALRSKIAGTEAPRRLEVSGKLSLGLDQAEVEREEEAWRAAGSDDLLELTPGDPSPPDPDDSK